MVALNIQKRRNQNFKVVAPAYLFCAACVWHESSMAALLQPQLSTGEERSRAGEELLGSARSQGWRGSGVLMEVLLALVPVPSGLAPSS